MASRKQPAAINFQPGQRRRFVFPARPRPHADTNLRPVSGPPAFSWSVSKLLLGARKRLASRAPAGVISTNRSAKFLQRNVITTASTLRFGPERHTVDGVLGCRD